jgi:hypothetical protein
MLKINKLSNKIPKMLGFLTFAQLILSSGINLKLNDPFYP